jgi:transposase-like protein
MLIQGGVFAVEASWQRSSMSAEHVLRRTLKVCLNKPLIYVDRGPWYVDALKSLGLKWEHI